MSVIGNSCTLPSEHSPGCGCGANANVGGKAAGASAMTALAAAACTSCCILPLTLPAVMLAGAGSTMAMLDHAHIWVTLAAILTVACAWLWIVWQVRKTQRRPARLTVVIMIVATLLTTIAASWPVIQPIVLNALGIVKKPAVSHIER
jgi:cytochrome bd-type quinol oxidase subunit 2